MVMHMVPGVPKGGQRRISSQSPEGLATEDVEMEVLDHLTRVRPLVRQEPKAGIGHPLAARELRTNPQELSCQQLVFWPKARHTGKVNLRNDEKMYTVFWSNISEGENVRIFVDDIRGNFSSENLAEGARRDPFRLLHGEAVSSRRGPGRRGSSQAFPVRRFPCCAG